MPTSWCIVVLIKQYNSSKLPLFLIFRMTMQVPTSKRNLKAMFSTSSKEIMGLSIGKLETLDGISGPLPRTKSEKEKLPKTKRGKNSNAAEIIPKVRGIANFDFAGDCGRGGSGGLLDQLATLATGELQNSQDEMRSSLLGIQTDEYDEQLSKSRKLDLLGMGKESGLFGGGESIVVDVKHGESQPSRISYPSDLPSQFSQDESQPLSQESIKSNLSEYGYDF